METIDPIVLETLNFKTIFNVCHDAMENHKMIVVTAPTGYGKTTAVVSFKLKYKDNVVITKAQKSMNARLFYSSIFNEIGDDNYNGGLPLYFSIRKAANVFTNESQNMLLIIDEAGRFNPLGLEYLHEFRDLTKGNTGIVLIGVNNFKTNLDNWNLKMKNGIPEFYRRINAFQELAPPTNNEIVNIIRAYDIIDEKFERYNIKKVKNFGDLTNNIKNYLTIKKKTVMLNSKSQKERIEKENVNTKLELTSDMYCI